jgi:ubiquinone/menaquinone biosynthesis C-methylase UbiE
MKSRTAAKRADNRSFYETSYHFDDDIVVPGEERLWKAIRMLDPLSGKSFLDLGSGVGWAAQLASERGGAGDVVGLDFAFRALKLGQESIPGVMRVQGDGTRLPFRDDCFERVLSFGSIEHFPDVVQGLRELGRILTPDGRAVVVVPNFYVRTEQPRELRLSYFGWRDRFVQAGLRIVATSADRGPAVLRDRRPARVVFRAGAKVLSFVPGLQYQFAFLLEHARGETI